jgi:signal transduction histidine kinase
MLRAGTQIVMFWGPDLVALYNDAYAPGIGDKHPRALGRPARENWAELWDDLEPLLKGVAETAQTFFSRDRPFYIERHGYGETTYWDVSYSAVVDEDGSVGGVICIVTETTDRVRAREALQDSERRLRELNATLERRVVDALAERRLMAEIVEGTDAFVQVADTEFRWRAVNRSAAEEFERIYGARPAVGRSMLDLLADKPEHQASVRAVWARALAGEAFSEISEFGDPARDRRSYEMKFDVLRGAEGEVIGAYQFVYDVTDRIERERRLAKAESALHQAQKMDAVGQLTGGVAHDFNNLLTPIVGALDSLSRRFEDDERVGRLTSGALQAAERARVLVQRLLAFSRRQHLEARSVDVGKLVHGMTDMIARSLGPQVRLSVDAPDGLPSALVDPNQFELSLLNLAVNARDAMLTAVSSPSQSGLRRRPGAASCRKAIMSGSRSPIQVRA